MGKTIAFNLESYTKNEPLIVYGASVYGEIAYVTLKEWGLTPLFYCDISKDKKEYFGIRVISPNELDNYKNANIIIASADFFYEIKNQLEKKGFVKLFDMSELICLDISKKKLSNRAKEIYANRKHYIDIVNNQSDEGLVFNRIQYVVTERCSLRCKDCSHLIQYYSHPQDIDLYKYKKSFDNLLECIDCMAELRILGGEPFINKNMGKLIEWYHDNNKIQGISVYTNGTIVPDEAILEQLKKNKVKVHISDYKINRNKIDKVVDVFENNNINYFIRQYDSWQDAGGVEFRGYSLEKRKNIFVNCFERNGYTFLKGKLYRCPRVAHAMNLGAMPDEKTDYVNLQMEDEKDSFKMQLKNLQERLWLEGCNYCGGPNNHIQNIPAARQVTEPLQYEMKNG